MIFGLKIISYFLLRNPCHSQNNPIGKLLAAFFFCNFLKLLTTTFFLGGMSLQEMTGLGAEEPSGSIAVGHGSCTEGEDSCSRGDSCGLGTHGRLEWLVEMRKTFEGL